jgi:hypothetical protein
MLTGCAHVVDGSTFHADKLITATTTRECEDYVQLAHRDLLSRARAYETCGQGVIRAIALAHRFKGKDEDMDLMDVEIPDFHGMITEGMTADQREYQLRWEEPDDEDGGERLPRRALVLRKYLCDPEGLFELPVDTVIFWSTNQCVREILRRERKLDLILPAKRAPKEETKPVGKLTINKGGKTSKAPGKAGAKPGKVGKPSVGTKRTPAKAKTSEPEPESSNGQGHVDLEAIVAAAVEGALAPVIKDLKAIRKENKDLKAAVAENRETTVTAVTLLHDIFINKTTDTEEEDEDGKTEYDREALVVQGLNILDYINADGDDEGK